ncbi:hypothetical protein [Muriicola soli]|uniref:KTSC domain-containing protein n=1 Tax=Muriicola soli TaxID=2507538 RepID=A0A411E656_9FLAO|nr:hypothetical protein [Muriicola soli]QBA63195.1 hypothetical protein EQY75_00660 [Muriicola soli]
MRKTLLIAFLISAFMNVKAQTCEELIDLVKSENNGTTYRSYDSEAISSVTFYNVFIEYKAYYFAIVCFKRKYSYNCDEYIYQVGSNTKLNYSIDHYDSAGKAFWKHIEPYSDVLRCSPKFD